MVTASRSATRTTIFLLLSLKIMLASACFPFASANFTLKVVSSARLRLTTARVVRKAKTIFLACLLPRLHRPFTKELLPVRFISVSPPFHRTIHFRDRHWRDRSNRCDPTRSTPGGASDRERQSGSWSTMSFNFALCRVIGRFLAGQDLLHGRAKPKRFAFAPCHELVCNASAGSRPRGTRIILQQRRHHFAQLRSPQQVSHRILERPLDVGEHVFLDVFLPHRQICDRCSRRLYLLRLLRLQVLDHH